MMLMKCRKCDTCHCGARKDRIMWTNGSDVETVVIAARSERTASVSSGPQLCLRAEKGMKSMPTFLRRWNKTVLREWLLEMM
jgi:hypothetical protein